MARGCNRVDNESEKQVYLDEYFEAEGIILEPENIKRNPGLRTVAKLASNSMWGRWGMRDNLSKNEYIASPQRLFELMGDEAIEVDNWCNDYYIRRKLCNVENNAMGSDSDDHGGRTTIFAFHES